MMLEARELSFGYDVGAPIIRNWSATIGKGEMVAITGPSGRGKSTLLYLLGLMQRPHSGDVLVDGIEYANQTDVRRARLRASVFGFVFQDALLDASRSVLDNVIESALYRDEPRREAIPRARRLLGRFGVDLRADAKPGQVSGGQAQRIALCRALLGNPSVLLADEPTGNLDRESAGIVVNAFRDQTQAGAAVVVVTHDADVVKRCDRSIRL